MSAGSAPRARSAMRFLAAPLLTLVPEVGYIPPFAESFRGVPEGARERRGPPSQSPHRKVPLAVSASLRLTRSHRECSTSSPIPVQAR